MHVRAGWYASRSPTKKPQDPVRLRLRFPALSLSHDSGRTRPQDTPLPSIRGPPTVRTLWQAARYALLVVLSFTRPYHHGLSVAVKRSGPAVQGELLSFTRPYHHGLSVAVKRSGPAVQGERTDVNGAGGRQEGHGATPQAQPRTSDGTLLPASARIIGVCVRSFWHR